jgi:ribose-phosphate pyrophosphokinase
MKYLNLTEGFNPTNAKEEDCIQFESFVFSGGEPHIKIEADYDKINNALLITQKVNSFNDLGLLCVAVDAMKELSHKFSATNLFIPYFPGARQDRRMVDGEPLTVKIYADIINAMDFDKVNILDAHSDVAPALLNKCYNMSNYLFVEEAIHSFESDGWKIISPDAGANKKVGALCQYLGVDSYVRCDKSRDVSTGNITGFEVYADDLEGISCVIVDDICDGGGTFIGLAKELKAKNAGKLYLVVTHGIFSKGFEQLNNYFEQIYTTDSFDGQRGSKVTEIKLKDIL